MTAFTDTEPGAVFTFAGTEDFFETLYGIPVTATGELCEGLLALGHLADRAVLAVTNAYHRQVYGHRILPSRELEDLVHFGTRHAWILTTRCDEDHDYAWEFKETDANAEQAQAVTLIDVEWLAHENNAVQSECPSCNKPSRSTREATGPGRYGWGTYHRCRHCDHQWPAAPAYPLRLERGRTWPTRDGSCFACHCLPDFPCTGSCAIGPDPVIGQPLCTKCRAQHSPEAWQQLAAVAYGTATRADSRDEQRDRWLYSEALRGIPPVQAAQAWVQRVTRTAQRAVARAAAATA